MLVSYRTLANIPRPKVETREESVGLGESGLSRMAKAGRRARVRAAQSLRGRNRAVAQGPSQRLVRLLKRLADDGRSRVGEAVDQEDVQHRSNLAAEGPLHQGVQDEDDRDEGEEDAVDVYFWELGRRLIMLWSFSFVTSIATPCFSPQG